MKFLEREVDPLTAPWHVMYRVVNVRTCKCSPLAFHDEACPLTPLYAALVDEQGCPFLYGLWGTSLAGWGFCDPSNPWCRHLCTLGNHDNRIIDPDCFRS